MPFIFPDDLGVTAKNANYMGFQTYQINGGVGSAKSDRDYKLVGGSVYLPIPVEGITDSTSNSWSPGDVNVAQMATASAVNEAGLDFSAASSGQDLVRSVIGTIGNKWNSAKSAAASVDAFTNPVDAARSVAGMTVSDIGDAFSSGMTTMGDALMKGAGPMGIGMGLNMLGAPVTQSTGIAGFNETAILYGGPQFRQFSFAFSLKPTSAAESGNIDDIITLFKEAAAPAEISGEMYRIYSLPHVFEIKFYHLDGENRWLPKLGMCALTGINAKYGGDRFQTFASGHAPVQVDLSLNFIELELQTKAGAHEFGGEVVGEFGAAPSAAAVTADKAAKARMQKKALGNAASLNRRNMGSEFPADVGTDAGGRGQGTDFPAAPPSIVF